MPPAPPMPPPKPSGSISIDARASWSAWGQGSAGAFAGQGVGFRPPTGFGSSAQIHSDGVPASAASATRRATPGRSAAVGPARRVRRHEEEQLGAVLVAQHRRRLFPFQLPSSAEEALQVEPARAEIEAVGACRGAAGRVTALLKGCASLQHVGSATRINSFFDPLPRVPQ